MAGQSTQHDAGPGERSAASPGRFGLLLLLLICAYLVSAFVTGQWVTVIQVVIFTGTALLALRNRPTPTRLARPALACVLIIATVALVLLLFTTDTSTGIANIAAGLILLSAALMILRRVFSFTAVTVTAQSIYGVLSVYIILGLMFSAFFAAIDHLSGGHFFANGQPASTQTFQYFSFTTLTTLGYGDFTAAGNPGRAIAVLEALTGQIYLITLVAFLVAQFRAPSQR
jgi:hypothetical protein